jgi:hypothetical protein
MYWLLWFAVGRLDGLADMRPVSRTPDLSSAEGFNRARYFYDGVRELPLLATQLQVIHPRNGILRAIFLVLLVCHLYQPHPGLHLFLLGPEVVVPVENLLGHVAPL